MSIEVITNHWPWLRMFASLSHVLLAMSIVLAQASCSFAQWGPLPPVSQRIPGAEIALVATCLSAARDYPDHGDPRQAEIGTSVFQIDWVAKGPASLAPEQQVIVPKQPVKVRGVRYLIFGTSTRRGIVWDVQASVSLAMIEYLRDAPSPLAPLELRLPYYFGCLDSRNPEIAVDAREVFAQTPLRDWEILAEILPADALRRGLENPDLSVDVHGVYGLLLGYSGDESDIPLLEELALENRDDSGIGVERLIVGYLMLAGDKGLDLLDKSKLRHPQTSDSDNWMAYRALQHMWSNGRGRIERDRLKQSMRILLDRPDMAELAITGLTRWKDWSCQQQLMQIFADKNYNNHVRRAIVRYFITASRDRPESAREAVPEHVVQSTRYLEELRKKDPLIVSGIESKL